MSKINLSSRNLALGAYLAASFALASSNAFALGSTPVTVVNPADIAKSEGIQHPFHENIVCDSGSGVDCHGFIQLPNQRAVIEFVSVQSIIDPGLVLSALSLDTIVGGTPLDQNIPFSDHTGATNGVFTFFSVGGPVRIYADANTEILAFGSSLGKVVPGFTGSFHCEMQISGQLIDVP